MDLSRAIWRKASRSSSNGGACVEVASLRSIVAVRDSKNPDGPKLIFPAAGWQSFTASIKAGRHDLA
jgi:hypothetical protein